MGHVSKWVAGVYTDAKTVEQDGPIYVSVLKTSKKRPWHSWAIIFSRPRYMAPSGLRSELLPIKPAGYNRKNLQVAPLGTGQ